MKPMQKIPHPLYSVEASKRCEGQEPKGVKKDLPTLEEKGVSTSNETSLAKKTCISANETIKPDSWEVVCNSASEIITDRLFLHNPMYSSDEMALLRNSNDAFKSGKSEWSPVVLDDDVSDDDIEMLLKIHPITGGFFSRIWYVRDKETNNLIGVIKTLGLDADGYSQIQRYLISDYCSKGLGSEALLAVFDFYAYYKAGNYQRYKPSEIRSKLTPIINQLSDRFLKETESRAFKLAWQSSTSFTDVYKALRATDGFPINIRRAVNMSIIKAFGIKENKLTTFNGLRSLPVSEASRRSLLKCGFTRKDQSLYKTVT